MKIGVLGGGQLGKMFLQNAYNYPFDYWVLDPSKNAPCQFICANFIPGDFTDYNTVLDFGKKVDVLSIEIEHVNIQALKDLKKLGKLIIPTPNTLEIIQDKGLQKQFYKEHNIPTSPFYFIQSKKDLQLSTIPYPFIQKTRKGGYDGKGVQLIKYNKNDIWNIPSVIEPCIKIKKELSIIVVKKGAQIKTFPVVEMIFNKELHLVDELFSPAKISKNITKEVEKIAIKTIQSFNSDGIFAIELFLTDNDNLLVNEIAPRVHNSGHHTIEANNISQFDAMLRVLSNLELGNLEAHSAATMLNIIGEKGYNGIANVVGLEEISKLENVFFHWYGKDTTKPGRKMGHITLLGKRNQELLNKIKYIKETLKVISL